MPENSKFSSSAFYLCLCLGTSKFAQSMRASDPDFFEALDFLNRDKTARRVFEIIAQQLGVSGWMIAKQSNQDLKDIAESLSQLDKIGIVKSSGPTFGTDPAAPLGSLEGNYALTPLGFSVRERLSAGSQSRA